MTTYLIQSRNSEGYWIDFSREQPTMDGLPERMRRINSVITDDVNSYFRHFRIIKRVVTEEVIDSVE